MTRSEVEPYIGRQVELTYTLEKNVPGVVIEYGIEKNVTIKKKLINRRVGVIITLTTKKAVFIMDDDGDDFEISILFENITKIRKVREYEAI